MVKKSTQGSEFRVESLGTICSGNKCLLGGVVDEASRVLGELDSRIHFKPYIIIGNLVPIGKKKKKKMVWL